MLCELQCYGFLVLGFLRPTSRVELTVVLVALLFSFLTMVAIWRIPPGGGTFVDGKDDSQATTTPEPTGLDNNLSRTVLAGLGGLAGVSIFEDVLAGGDAGNLKALYLAWFVVLFLSVLVLYACLRSLTEVFRYQVARLPWVESSVPEKKEEDGESDDAQNKARSKKSKYPYKFRSAAIIFSDAFFNVVQGKNQFENAVLGETIVELQESLVRTLDRLAEHIQRTIVRSAGLEGQGSVRVNISVMADDGKTLWYISLARGSLLHPFSERSVGWVAVAAGKGRWFKDAYSKNWADIVLFDNRAGSLPDQAKAELTLKEHFQERGRRDYGGFVVLPVPWGRHLRLRDQRKAGIHISFGREEDLDHVWSNLDQKKGVPRYEDWRGLIKPPERGASGSNSVHARSSEVAAALDQAVHILPELVRTFNFAVFERFIRPR